MTATVEFVKIHGIGNDFILINAEDLPTDPRLALSLCDRHRGVGADGVLFYSTNPPGMVVLNADGSRPEMCGNGLRCVARWLVEHHHFPEVLDIQTDAGVRRCEVNPANGQVTIDMGVAAVSDAEDVDLDGEILRGIRVNMGNPHFVVHGFRSLEEIDHLGAIANHRHNSFPEGVNVEFVRETEGLLDVIVYERGVGRTQACGTGACAVAAVAWRDGKEGVIDVRLPGGILKIERRQTHVWMTGQTEVVYRGAVDNQWFVERMKPSEAGQE